MREPLHITAHPRALRWREDGTLTAQGVCPRALLSALHRPELSYLCRIVGQNEDSTCIAAVVGGWADGPPGLYRSPLASSVRRLLAHLGPVREHDVTPEHASRLGWTWDGHGYRPGEALARDVAYEAFIHDDHFTLLRFVDESALPAIVRCAVAAETWGFGGDPDPSELEATVLAGLLRRAEVEISSDFSSGTLSIRSGDSDRIFSFSLRADPEEIGDPDALARTGWSAALRLRALAQVQDQQVIAQVALHDTHDEVRVAAAKRVISNATQAALAVADDPDVRRAVVDHTEDEALLVRVAIEDGDPDVAAAAVARLRSPAALRQVATSSGGGMRCAWALIQLGDVQLSLERLPLLDPRAALHLAWSFRDRETLQQALGPCPQTDAARSERAWTRLLALKLTNDLGLLKLLSRDEVYKIALLARARLRQATRQAP